MGKNTCQTSGGRKTHTFNSHFGLKVIKIECQLKLRITFILQTPLNLAGEQETGLFLPGQRHEFVNRQESPQSGRSERTGHGRGEASVRAPDGVWDLGCPLTPPAPR